MTALNKSISQTEKKILEPYLYLTENPGKGVRSKIIQAFNVWLRVPEDKLIIICESTEMLHNSSLLIDDIEDGSKLRRGKPAAHTVFGEAITINCANYVYFLAQQHVLSLNRIEAVSIFTEEVVNLHRGQGMEIVHRNSGECPTEDQYLEIVSNKTGGLMRLAIRLMLLFATIPCDFDVVGLSDLLGIYFQVRDDYINLQSDEFMKDKGFCEDITEGKFSFPIVHSCLSDPNNKLLIDILAMNTEDVTIQKRAIDYIKSTGSFEYSVNYLRVLEKQLHDSLKVMGGNDVLSAVINKLADAYKHLPQTTLTVS